LGSAIVLGLLKGKVDAEPTTAYLMNYREGKCAANCGFCPQARGSQGKADMLSRVSWPVFETTTVINGLKNAVMDGKIRRVCFQALNYPEVFSHLQAHVKAIRRQVKVPISVSCQPLNTANLKLLAEAGVERVGIPLDAATEEIFDKIKGTDAGGPYNWKRQFELLGEAVKIFGKGNASTHLIVGLGETEREMVAAIQQCVDSAVLPALFAFTPIAGTVLEKSSQPMIQSYRRIQVARHLITDEIVRYQNIRFDKNGRITDFGVEKQALTEIVKTGKPFLTSGCLDCNRPYYNEKPSGPIYNYPKELTEKDLKDVQAHLGLIGSDRL
jgi:biotin synthase